MSDSNNRPDPRRKKGFPTKWNFYENNKKEYDKAKHKDEIDRAMIKFLAQGGKIAKCPTYIPKEISIRENERCLLEILAYRRLIKEELDKRDKLEEAE